MIAVGESLPEATFLRIGPNGPEPVALRPLVSGRKVILFGLPGAFTPTCDSSHLPSFIRTRAAFSEKGVDEIICVSVNDPHVMRVWGEISGATEAGITLLADPGSDFTRAMGLNYDKPESGFYDRSRRYALIAEDGVVTVFHLEEMGVCSVSTGEAMLAELA